jgi:MFS family permease
MNDQGNKITKTNIPTRLDRLPWGRFHTLIVIALGITWVLDGLEVTLAGSVAGALETSPRLHFTARDIGLAASLYLSGAIIGALGFAWLTDRLGRRPMFFITLSVYLVFTAATALSWNLASFCLFRFLTWAGIGGENSAVNSTIQEMIPARYRGWTDLAINGSFWIGGALGAVASIAVLDPGRFDPDIGWRLAFLVGSVLGLFIILLRAWIPESPRWLVIHGRQAEAEKIVDEIEASFRLHRSSIADASLLKPMVLRPRRFTPLKEVFTRSSWHSERERLSASLSWRRKHFFIMPSSSLTHSF